jgi:hypothetical protein
VQLTVSDHGEEQLERNLNEVVTGLQEASTLALWTKAAFSDAGKVYEPDFSA